MFEIISDETAFLTSSQLLSWGSFSVVYFGMTFLRFRPYSRMAEGCRNKIWPRTTFGGYNAREKHATLPSEAFCQDQEIPDLTAAVVYLRGPEFLHWGDAHPNLNAVPLQTSLYYQHDLVQKHSLHNLVSLH